METSPKLRIGLSMRTTQASGYEEKRDSIARDWSQFLLHEFPTTDWLYLPNIDNSIVSFCKNWGLNGFILSGGEDIGTDIVRDKTETQILDYAQKHHLPLLGICRGTQLIYQYFGGLVEEGSTTFKETHCATSHNIIHGGRKVLVNSYHKNRLKADTLPPNLSVAAKCESDNSIEAISGENLLGLMWHPERSLAYDEWSISLIKDFFKLPHKKP